MGERGIDISEWQIGMNTEQVSLENDLSFAFVRTNYGSNHDDLQFHKFCDGFDRAGVLVTPYCYPLASDTRGSIDDALRIIGGRYPRVAIDWEHGSGGGDHLRAAHERAWEHDLETPVVYDPKWYWEQQGSPNVDWMGKSRRIGGRWKSWYPDNVPGSFNQILNKIPNSVWNDSRGGIATRIVQFTSSGRLNGWSKNLDLNYFPGTHAELTELLGGADMTPDQSDKLDKIFGKIVNDRYGLEGRPSTDEKEDLYGHVMNTGARVVELLERDPAHSVEIDYDKLADALQQKGLLLPKIPTAEELAKAFVAEMKKEGN